MQYDELSLQEFNKKARTPEGKPLAMDNGKITSNPNFTNKNNLYTPGQCTYYVFDKRAADGNTISTFWGMRTTGQAKLKLRDLE